MTKGHKIILQEVCRIISLFRMKALSIKSIKYSDDTAVVACVRGGQEKEFRDLVESFYGWTKNNCLLLNTTKTKELVVDFRRSKTPYQSVCIDGGEIETVRTCKYLGVVLHNKLEWSASIETVYRRDQSSGPSMSAVT